MVFPAKPTASQEVSPTITPCSPAAPTKYSVLYRILAKCSVLTSCPIQVLAHASFFAPCSYPSIWLTNISPTSYDELRSHPRTAPDADPDHDCRGVPLSSAPDSDLQALQHLLSEGVNLNVATTTTTTTATPLHLAAPTTEPRHTSPS